MIVSAPFSRQMQPKRSAPRVAASSRCAFTQLGLLAEQPRQLAGMRRQHRPGTPVARLELVQGVRVERRAAPRRRRAARRAGSSPPACVRAPGRSRSRRAFAEAASASAHVTFTGSQQPHLDHRERRLGHGDRHVAGIGAKGRRGREADRRPSARGEPPTTSTEPRCTCCPRGRLRGTSDEDLGRRPARSVGRSGSSPMSATTASPVWKRPGETASPALRPWNVTVTVARTASPATSPVDASTPEGTSTETTGAAAALIRWIVAAASARGSPWKPVPNSASMITSACSTAVVSTASRPSSRRIRRCDPPVAPVRAAAADDGDPVRIGEELQHLVGRPRHRPAPSAPARSPGSRDTAPRPRRISAAV